MADESVRDIVRRVRRTLQEKGPLGAFLLAELDAAISRGTDELPEGLRNSKAASSETAGMRSPNEDELLAILHNVFETYLITLPSVAASLTSRLRDRFAVAHCEITLDPSLLGDELQLTGRVRLDAIVPSSPDIQVVEALSKIGRLLRRREE